MTAFRPTASGEWFITGHGGRRTFLACCDCGLVHRVEFRVRHEGARHRIAMRGFRDRLLTRRRRRDKVYAFRRRTP